MIVPRIGPADVTILSGLRKQKCWANPRAIPEVSLYFRYPNPQPGQSIGQSMIGPRNCPIFLLQQYMIVPMIGPTFLLPQPRQYSNISRANPRDNHGLAYNNFNRANPWANPGLARRLAQLKLLYCRGCGSKNVGPILGPFLK